MSTVAAREGAGVVAVEAEVLANTSAGAYRRLLLATPGLPELADPGQFVALSVGDGTSSMLLRRSFSIHRVDVGAGTTEIVVAVHGEGTRVLTGLQPGETVSVIGPLGRGFRAPEVPGACVLVGGGYGSAPLFWLAERLREQGCTVHLVLGAATRERLFGLEEAERLGCEVLVTTDDGSAGRRGWVSDVLPDLITRTGAVAVHGCGPMGMLASITRIATEHGIPAQVGVEEAMACGVGLCMTCVLPVRDAGGTTSMVRSCVDGPVLDGDRVRWEAFSDGRCEVPADAVGAPKGAAR
ncbi:dihydroorotate dehydrogenase electron transfer subunit [Janibacter corallicola]|uniref:dihydroorotate dehydrogenase electron transfer subunit n=1 Tax=Janibacter corallicola TaxID=415212 RepID=UPI00082D603C|nr:dihydroorotate dehydrogenase electron transfer subunit [Janibacter corallicola]